MDEYRIMPGSGEWVSEEDLVRDVLAWARKPRGTGVPAITISKRVRETDPID